MPPPQRWRALGVVASNASSPPVRSTPAIVSRWQSPSSRSFSICPQCRSKIGRSPLTVPPGVSFEVLPPPQIKKRRVGGMPAAVETGLATVNIKGPLGELSYQVPPFVNLTRDSPESPVTVTVGDSRIRHQREMWGTVRAYLSNHILGVSEGHTAILRLVGVGYRATIESTATTVSAQFPGQNFVNLKVGYSHPIELPVPAGVKASTPQPTRLLLEGADKEVVMSFAAEIRKWRVPEPYKGKGIFVNGETIKLKNKKIK